MFGKDGEKKIINPIKFLKDEEQYQQNPITFMDLEINGAKRFAILKTTEGGKYLRGNMLWYKLGDVQIYTDPTNIIFVDTVNMTLWVRDNDKVSNEINPTNPEERQYIMLYMDLGYEEELGTDNEFPLRWEAVTGRSEAYNNIKLNASVIDIDKSLVLVETVSFKDSLTVRQFVEYLKNSDIINEESFDINDFAGSLYV